MCLITLNAAQVIWSAARYIKVAEVTDRNEKVDLVVATKIPAIENSEALFKDVAQACNNEIRANIFIEDFVPTNSQNLRTYLANAGVSVIDATSKDEFIFARATISTWESILSTKFDTYRDVLEINPPIYRATTYYLDNNFSKYVAFIYNATEIPKLNKYQRVSNNLESNNILTAGFSTHSSKILTAFERNVAYFGVPFPNLEDESQRGKK